VIVGPEAWYRLFWILWALAVLSGYAGIEAAKLHRWWTAVGWGGVALLLFAAAYGLAVRRE
jgi:hypothetical protein